MRGPRYTGMSASIAESRRFLAIGAASAAIALKPVLAVPVLIAAFAWWIFLAPSRWLFVFFALALLTPPLPVPVGESGLNVAPFAACLGLLIGAIRSREWRDVRSPVSSRLLLFAGVLTVSSAIGALYSGVAVALGSFARTALFGIGVYVFFHALRGPSEDPRRIARFLLFAAAAAALFACADYYFQFPAPAGFEAQFVWLDDGVFRRAQGLFYEASTLGNFCAFFLVMAMVGLTRRREESVVPKLLLIPAALLFTVTLILSYSRGSALAVIAGGISLMTLRRVRFWRVLSMAGCSVFAAGLVVYLLLPSFFANYAARIAGSFQNLAYAPNAVLSGRLANWQALIGFLIGHPWQAIAGIGYKTLPYSDITGAKTIADNTWLSLLVETGIAGLGCFVALNAAILKSAYRSARTGNFYGQWIFCFWVGEMAQMFSGDLITYWRILPVYFWVLGTALREAE
ncbi:MAG: O-antigen ligase family protein [Acidobacteriota bacterium]|nr:O-antigen ligase family protein [Acidobacteriota bacterium]